MTTAPDANPAGPSMPPLGSEQAAVSPPPELAQAMASPLAPGEETATDKQAAAAQGLAEADSSPPSQRPKQEPAGPWPSGPEPPGPLVPGPVVHGSLPPRSGGPAEATLRELQEQLLERCAALRAEVGALERQRDRLLQEIGATPIGRSELIANRLKGFQSYLVGALQELAAVAEQAELVREPVLVQPSPLDRVAPIEPPPPAAAGLFSQDADQIRQSLARYGGQPDFYADPWKLRRSLEPTAAALLDDWFLNQGGRDAQPSGGSRNRNVLVAAAAIAILGELYGDRFQTLVLAGLPERLGEWRRGLQDCLGLGREDFGPNSGIVLFERADALIDRADRLEERGELPFIVIDAAEEGVAIPVLQFPLWLAFAAAPDEIISEEMLY